MADAAISDVPATMRQFQIQRVPVVDGDGSLQGVLSLSDIVLASHDKREPQACAILAAMTNCAHRPVATAVE